MTPTLCAAFEQQWQQMQAEAQQLDQAQEMYHRARAASLRLLVARSQRALSSVISDRDFIGRCQLVAWGLRINPELETHLRAQGTRWQGRLDRIEGTRSAIEDYQAFLLRLREQVHSRTASGTGALVR